MTEPLDLEPINARMERAETIAGHPIGPFMDAWVQSARDVPALVAEVERLREENAVLDRMVRRAAPVLADLLRSDLERLKSETLGADKDGR